MKSSKNETVAEIVQEMRIFKCRNLASGLGYAHRMQEESRRNGRIQVVPRGMPEVQGASRKRGGEVNVRTISQKQMRNAYEYMVSHGCIGVTVDGLEALVDAADTWDANGRRDCFTTGDLGVQIRKVPDKELKPYYDEAVRIVNETFPEQCGVMVECFVRLSMFMEIAMSALKDIASGDLPPRMWGNCAAVALADMEKDASNFPRPFGWKFGKGFFRKEANRESH